MNKKEKPQNRDLYIKIRVNQQEIHKLAASIARNINQITTRFHDTGRLYENDIAELKDGVNRLWQPLIFLQREILQLKH